MQSNELSSPSASDVSKRSNNEGSWVECYYIPDSGAVTYKEAKKDDALPDGGEAIFLYTIKF